MLTNLRAPIARLHDIKNKIIQKNELRRYFDTT